MDVISKEERMRLDAQNRAVEDKAWWAIGKLKITACTADNPLLTLTAYLEGDWSEIPLWILNADKPGYRPCGNPDLTDLIVNGPRLRWSEEEQRHVEVPPDDYPWGNLDAEAFLKEKDPQRVMEMAATAVLVDMPGLVEAEFTPLDQMTDITRD